MLPPKLDQALDLVLFALDRVRELVDHPASTKTDPWERHHQAVHQQTSTYLSRSWQAVTIDLAQALASASMLMLVPASAASSPVILSCVTSMGRVGSQRAGGDKGRGIAHRHGVALKNACRLAKQ